MIRTKPVTPEYEDSWERVFNGPQIIRNGGNAMGKSTELVKEYIFKHLNKNKTDAVATEECKCTTTCSAAINVTDTSDSPKLK